MKRCCRCGETKPLDAFGNNARAKDGKVNYCKPCKSSYNRKTRYNLTDEVFHQLYYQQRGRCGICGKHTDLHIDHCHTTQQIRGLLCSGCNTSLGKMGDDVETLENAIKYLKGGQT